MLQENMEEEIRKGNDIVANAVVPGKSQLLVFATPKAHGIYQGFEYDAIAIAYENSDIVDVLDISVFMTPVDVKPARMDRARFKMHDFLRETKDGQNALILYDNEPFVAVPLTTDQKVVEQILPTVQAGMMGGRMPDVNLALQKAGELLKQAGATKGRIVLLGGYICDDEMPQVL